MKAYKITSKDLKSLTVRSFAEGVQYKLSEATIPQFSCGPLAAFKSLKNVSRFKRLNGWESCPVFECEVERDKKSKGLWGYTPWYGKKEFSSPLPEGTILCKKIILRRLIE